MHAKLLGLKVWKKKLYYTLIYILIMVLKNITWLSVGMVVNKASQVDWIV